MVIWPDHDDDGMRYAETVTRLAAEAGARLVSVVRVPEHWPEKWDLADTLPDGVTEAELHCMVTALRGELAKAGQHLRTPEAAANLLWGLRTFLQFAVESGAISRESAERLRRRSHTALAAVADDRPAMHCPPIRNTFHVPVDEVGACTVYGVTGCGDVTISFYNHDGSYLTGFTDRLPTRAFKQYTRVLGSFAPVVNAYAIIRCDTPDATFFSYQSQIDMVTGDPVYRHGRVINTFDTVYLAAGARTEGLEGPSWVTDMVVLNRSGTEKTLTAELWLRDRANFSPLSRTMTLADGQQVVYADVLSSLFGIVAGSAAIRVSGAEGVLIDSRTYSSTETGNDGSGTYGQYIAAVPEYGNVLVPGGQGYNLACIEDSVAGNSFRTNIGLVNLSLDPAKLRVAVHDTSGAKLGEKVYNLPVKGYRQISSVLEDILGTAGESITAAYLRYTLVSSTGRVLGYRSTIDNTSGDPVFEPAWMKALPLQPYLPASR